MTGPIHRKPRRPIKYQNSVFIRFANYLKLFRRLLFDGQVNILLKLIPLAALIYVINPLDRIIPVVDDLVIAGLAVYLFVELSPPQIVAQHRRAIEGVLEGEWRDAAEDETGVDDPLDGEFHE